MQKITYEMDLHTVQNQSINAITICIDTLIILQASVYYYLHNNQKRLLITQLQIYLKFCISFQKKYDLTGSNRSRIDQKVCEVAFLWGDSCEL